MPEKNADDNFNKVEEQLKNDQFPIDFYKSLNQSERINFLQKIGEEKLCDIFSNLYLLQSSLRALPNGEMIEDLLTHLPPAHLQKITTFKLGIDSFQYFFRVKVPISDRLSLLVLLEDLDILKTIIANEGINLSDIVQYLTKEHQEIFLGKILDKSYLQSLLPDGFTFFRMPESCHHFLVNLFPLTHLAQICESRWNLENVLQHLDSSHMAFLYNWIGLNHLRGLYPQSNLAELKPYLSESEYEKLSSDLKLYQIDNLTMTMNTFPNPDLTYAMLDGNKLYHAKQLDAVRIVGLSQRSLKIYNLQTQQVEQSLADIVDYSLIDNKLAVVRLLNCQPTNEPFNGFIKWRNEQAIELYQWQDKQLVNVGTLDVPLKFNLREQVVKLFPLTNDQLLVISAEHMNIINSCKNWHLHRCDLKQLKSEEVLTVKTPEHFFVRDLVLLADGKTLLGFNEFCDEDPTPIGLINTDTFEMETLRLNHKCEIKAILPLPDNKVLIKTNMGNLELAFRYFKELSQANEQKLSQLPMGLWSKQTEPSAMNIESVPSNTYTP